MHGNDTSTNKIHNIITHFLMVYEDAEQLEVNNNVIARVFIHATLNERLFDEKRRIIEPLPSPNQEALLQHSIQQLCDLKTPESIHDFIERVVNLDSTKYRIEIPYEDITSFIYDFSGDIPDEAIDERLGEFSGILKNNVRHLRNYEALKVEKVYKKFERHIKLALSQKRYIKEVTSKSSSDAKVIADIANLTAHNAKLAANKANEVSGKVQRALSDAEHTIEQAQQSATKALTLSNNVDSTMKQAKSLAEKAEKAAQHAQQLANEADAQAKSTIANYISILGIFASIIFTLFGGVNLIGSTVKLLETGSRWPYLTFIISLLMICLLTLLNMMVKWINSMSNLKRALEKEEIKNSGKLSFKLLNPCTWDFYTKGVSCFLIVLLLSMCGMYRVNKENLFSFSKETTSKMLPKTESNNQSRVVENKDSEKEMTVIEKITIANHSNESKDDKEDK